MVDSKIYGFPPPSKMIDVDDGVAAVGYKLLSTPPLLILNRRTPLRDTVELLIVGCDIWRLATRHRTQTRLLRCILLYGNKLTFSDGKNTNVCFYRLLIFLIPMEIQNWNLHLYPIVLQQVARSNYTWNSAIFRFPQKWQPLDQCTWMYCSQPLFL